MSNPYFRFRQFEVMHDRCAMKVGTDGVLLGAWAELPTNRANRFFPRLLDVGCGCGLIALMLAQRFPNSVVDAVEIDRDAAEQATENVERSPWSNRIRVWHGAFPPIIDQLPEAFHSYDLVVSNPPFHREQIKSPKLSRAMARHCDSLSYADLIASIPLLLSPEGLFSVILPYDAGRELDELASEHELFLCRETAVHPLPNKPPKRLLKTFSLRRLEPKRDQLILCNEQGGRSNDYQSLTEAFYL